MNNEQTIPITHSSSLDGAGIHEQFVKKYINLVNRVITRRTENIDDEKYFDSLSISGIP